MTTNSRYDNPNNRTSSVSQPPPSGADLTDAHALARPHQDEIEDRRKVRTALNQMRRTLRLPALPDDVA